MRLMTLPPPSRLTTSSSSQRLEALLPVASGLPLQGSIAGCLTSAGHPEEWNAALEPLGHQRNLPWELLHATAHSGAVLFFFRNALVHAASHANDFVDCVFSTESGKTYLVQCKRSEALESKPAVSQEPMREIWEPVAPDTQGIYTIREMARAWEAMGRPITEEDQAMSADPDEYPLF